MRNSHLLAASLLLSTPAIAPAENKYFDFGSVPTEGYVTVRSNSSYNATQGWGWTTNTVMERDRGVPEGVMRDFVMSQGSEVFRINTAPGIYRLTLKTGEMEYGDHVLRASIPQAGITFPSVQPPKGELAEMTTALRITGNSFDLHLETTGVNWILNALELEEVSSAEGLFISTTRLPFEFVYQDDWTDVLSWPDPTAPLLAQYRQDLSTLPAAAPLGLDREDYLDTVESNIDYFLQYQDSHGAIIDPHRNFEYQYSTPCFALGAAALVAYRQRTDLTEPAAKAMDWSVKTLSEGNAATNHDDFFSIQIAHALPLLEGNVDAQRVAMWEQQISSFDPFYVYTSAPGGGNWNIIAASGEAAFINMGLKSNKDFVEHSFARQGRFFRSQWGLYLEGPMPYDHFPRVWAADMLSTDFEMAKNPELREVIRRASITSMFMQSPTGELPTGGRSAHHQWNEAMQCVTFEIYAAEALENGDVELAGAFKRAARLSLSSIQRWIRPSGELWIVKNQAPPEIYHGYEGYSSHSQYNLLAMAALVISYKHAETTEAVPEVWAPSEVGGFIVNIPELNKVFANSGGMYVEIETGADPKYNATGLLRVHRKGCDPQLGPSDSCVSNPSPRYPTGAKTTTAASGIAWKDDSGQWRRLAEFSKLSGLKAEVIPITVSPRNVKFQVVHRRNDFNGPDAIIETYNLTPDEARLSVQLEGGGARETAMVWPILANNGAQNTIIVKESNQTSVELDGNIQTFRTTGSDPITLSADTYAHRNGWMRIATAKFSPDTEPVLIFQPTPDKFKATHWSVQ